MKINDRLLMKLGEVKVEYNSNVLYTMYTHRVTWSLYVSNYCERLCEPAGPVRIET